MRLRMERVSKNEQSIQSEQNQSPQGEYRSIPAIGSGIWIIRYLGKRTNRDQPGIF